MYTYIYTQFSELGGVQTHLISWWTEVKWWLLPPKLLFWCISEGQNSFQEAFSQSSNPSQKARRLDPKPCIAREVSNRCIHCYGSSCQPRLPILNFQGGWKFREENRAGRGDGWRSPGMTIEVPMVELAGSNGSRLQEKNISEYIRVVCDCMHTYITLQYVALHYIHSTGIPKRRPSK
jgi:hypothetical protein